MLLTGLVSLSTQCAFLYTLGLKNCATHNGMNPSTPITGQENVPTDLPVDQSNRCIFLISSSFFPDDPGLCQVNKKKKKNLASIISKYKYTFLSFFSVSHKRNNIIIFFFYFAFPTILCVWPYYHICVERVCYGLDHKCS